VRAPRVDVSPTPNELTARYDTRAHDPAKRDAISSSIGAINLGQRRTVRRATPATLTGVAGRPTIAMTSEANVTPRAITGMMI
jgi:hypothetical protein